MTASSWLRFDGADIAVMFGAFCTMLGGVAVALISSRKVSDKIGTPNGRGNVVEMIERSLDQQALLMDGQAAMLAAGAAQDQRLATIEQRLTAGDDHLHGIDRRLDRLEIAHDIEQT